MDPADPYGAISACVRDYVVGMCRAEPDLIRRAMHEKASVIGHFQGGLEWETRDAFIAMVTAAVKEPDPDPWFRINAITVTGDIAVVQVEDVWLGDHYDDVLTLLHHDGAWVIVSKAFYLRPGG